MALQVVTPTYTTHTEFLAYSRNATVVTALAAEAAWKPYALMAEVIIDEYVGQVPKYDPEQERKFPIEDENGASEFPDDLKLAHIDITTDLYLKGQQTAFSGVSGPVTQESWNDSGYSRTMAQLKGMGAESVQMMIPPYAKLLLRKYKNTVLVY